MACFFQTRPLYWYQYWIGQYRFRFRFATWTSKFQSYLQWAVTSARNSDPIALERVLSLSFEQVGSCYLLLFHCHQCIVRKVKDLVPDLNSLSIQSLLWLDTRTADGFISPSFFLFFSFLFSFPFPIIIIIIIIILSYILSA
jgi:hypothetical protein